MATTTKKPKILKGFVVSDKMKDTVVVSVTRYVKHRKYGKYMMRQKKYKAHDAGNTKRIGERVEIIEVAPISKDKHFKIIDIKS
jgi:small subunit ribosomal protein S17